MKYKIIILSTLYLLFSCTPVKTADEYITSAQNNLKTKDQSSALINLKNAVKQDLKNSKARLLLGKLYLNLGEATSAEKELTKALILGASPIKTLPSLLKTLNILSENEKIIAIAEQYADIDDSEKPALLLYKALAYSNLGNNKRAKTLIEHANEISTNSIYSQLGSAYLNASILNIDGALEQLSNILKVSPTLIEAHLLKGQLYFIKKLYPEAIDSFKTYQKLVPNDLKIRLFLANTYLKSGLYKQANKEVSYLLEKMPEHAFSNQIKGILDYQNGDFKSALSHSEKAIQNGIDTPSNRAIAGLSAFKLKNFEQAYQYLMPTGKLLPPSHPINKVLSMVQMQLGYIDEAGETLSNIDAITSDDIDLLTTASFELLKNGNLKQAVTTLDKVDQLGSLKPIDIMKIGVLKLSMNDLEGVTDLEKAVDIDPDLPMAKMMLAAAYIQTNELQKALKLANTWKAKEPEKVDGYNLSAKIFLIQKNIFKAESELDEALKIDPNNLFSLLYYANKQMVNNQTKTARLTLEHILKIKPDNITALIKYHKVLAELDNKNTAINKIKESYERNQDKIEYTLLYAKVLMVEKNFTQVIEVLDHKKYISKNTPSIYWQLLAISYQQTKQIDKALATYTSWVGIAPNNRVALLTRISLLDKLKKYPEALKSVKNVLAKIPSDEQFNALLIHYLLLNNQNTTAQAKLNELTKEQRNKPFLQGLQGQLDLISGKYKEALIKLKTAYNAEKTSRNAGFIYSTFMKQNQNKKAYAFLKTHTKEQPNDLISKAFLANMAIIENPETAKKTYIELLKSAPNNITFLNNLAWLELKEKDYTSAKSNIKKALKIAPNHPQIIDTAALIHWGVGSKEKAVKLITEAKRLAPNNKDIIRHYNEMVRQ